MSFLLKELVLKVRANAEVNKQALALREEVAAQRRTARDQRRTDTQGQRIVEMNLAFTQKRLMSVEGALDCAVERLHTEGLFAHRTKEAWIDFLKIESAALEEESRHAQQQAAAGHTNDDHEASANAAVEAALSRIDEELALEQQRVSRRASAMSMDDAHDAFLAREQRQEEEAKAVEASVDAALEQEFCEEEDEEEEEADRASRGRSTAGTEEEVYGEENIEPKLESVHSFESSSAQASTTTCTKQRYGEQADGSPLIPQSVIASVKRTIKAFATEQRNHAHGRTPVALHTRSHSADDEENIEDAVGEIDLAAIDAWTEDIQKSATHTATDAENQPPAVASSRATSGLGGPQRSVNPGRAPFVRRQSRARRNMVEKRRVPGEGAPDTPKTSSHTVGTPGSATAQISLDDVTPAEDKILPTSSSAELRGISNLAEIPSRPESKHSAQPHQHHDDDDEDEDEDDPMAMDAQFVDAQHLKHSVLSGTYHRSIPPWPRMNAGPVHSTSIPHCGVDYTPLIFLGGSPG